MRTEDTVQHKKGSWCSADTTNHLKCLLFISYCLVKYSTHSLNNRQWQSTRFVHLRAIAERRGEALTLEARGRVQQICLESPCNAIITGPLAELPRTLHK